jgi:uncharacterized membrane protein YfcA
MVFFRVVSADGLRLLVGGIAIGFVVFQIAREWGWLRAATRSARPGLGVFWGTVTGFTSYAGGPPASMYLLGSGHDKTRFQASTVLAFALANLIKLPPYVALGMLSVDAPCANLLLAPVALGGVVLGVARTGLQAAYALLLATGAKLVFDAAT